MIDKRATLAEAIATVPDGARIALGGNTLHRGPGAAVHEIVRQRKHGLVIAGLRAAIQGVPFMPVAGLQGSDLPAARGFQAVADPYSDAHVYVVPALVPDVAILHVQEVDSTGNGLILGTRFEDVLMAQAARRVVLTTERIIDGAAFADAPESVAIPSFLVDAVVAVPGGAWPFSCTPHYEYDAAYLAAWVAAARELDTARDFIASHVLASTPVPA